MIIQCNRESGKFTDIEKMLIEKAQLKIFKVIAEKGIDSVALSFSGGKDSTVLKHLINTVSSSVKPVFCNTGVEYKKIVSFVKDFADVQIVKPKYSFVQVIKKYGYPIISKEQSRYLSDIKNPKVCQRIKDIRLGPGKNFTISKKWRWLLDQDDFKISDKCCYHLKKSPLIRLKYYYFTGERITESTLRKQKYKTCILPNKCIPLRLWSDELVNKYIAYHDIKLCDIYKHETRTGCKFCLYGIQFEKRPNRIDRLEYLEPESYKFAKSIGIIDLMEKILNHKKLNQISMFNEV
jgi:3'-phosphoadenosine 5'-phosphosulfate sulfotransferase (PAPS reductase)/FAD synthetase